MINIPGYEIKEEIYVGADSIVYKAVENENNKPVIIKLLKSEYPEPDELKDFQGEYNIAKSLESIEGIVRNYQMIDYQNTKAIILEDFGGISLDKIIKEKKLDIKTFLYIAVKCAGILEEIHKHKIIHKDI
ncbi:MAG: protein kinase, partial [Deltaproteobacteria bacterium]|nr:protein kinase [Deltaproteobacteria bacterium]